MRGPGIHQFAVKPGEVTLFEHALGTKSIFGLLEKNPEQKQAFDDYMKSRRLINAPQWFDIYPTATEFANARKDADAILLVDIAGGPGQEVERFKQRYPDIPGRCVLQDLPLTLQRIDKLHEGIEAMAYDFFTPQPLKGMKITSPHNNCCQHVQPWQLTKCCTRRSRVLPPEYLTQLVGRSQRQDPVACGRSHGFGVFNTPH